MGAPPQGIPVGTLTNVRFLRQNGCLDHERGVAAVGERDRLRVVPLIGVAKLSVPEGEARGAVPLPKKSRPWGRPDRCW